MKNKIILSTILLVIVLIFSFILLIQNKGKDNEQQKQETSGSQVILFYGDGCPHCAIVEDYLRDNQVENSFPFTRKEVYHNSNNAKELGEKAKNCGIPANSIGVPLLWDGQKCLIGDEDIINFFKQKING